jgi:hypothetical protein
MSKSEEMKVWRTNKHIHFKRLSFNISRRIHSTRTQRTELIIDWDYVWFLADIFFEQDDRVLCQNVADICWSPIWHMYYEWDISCIQKNMKLWIGCIPWVISRYWCLMLFEWIRKTWRLVQHLIGAHTWHWYLVSIQSLQFTASRVNSIKREA